MFFSKCFCGLNNIYMLLKCVCEAYVCVGSLSLEVQRAAGEQINTIDRCTSSSH